MNDSRSDRHDGPDDRKLDRGFPSGEITPAIDTSELSALFETFPEEVVERAAIRALEDLHDFRGLSFQEIGEMFAVPPDRVQELYRRWCLW